MLPIENYDFNFLRERYCEEYPEFATSFDQSVDELRKFLKLPLLCDGPLAAMSHKVDKLWHLFIEHTPQYKIFCNKAYGGYLHHQPRSETYPVPVAAISNFYKEYPKHFGEVPSIWFEDIPPAQVAAVALGQVPPEVQKLRWSGWPGWLP